MPLIQLHVQLQCRVKTKRPKTIQMSPRGTSEPSGAHNRQAKQTFSHSLFEDFVKLIQ